MSKIKKFKTYSKSQKVSEYSTLFSNVASTNNENTNKTSNESEEISEKQNEQNDEIVSTKRTRARTAKKSTNKENTLEESDSKQNKKTKNVQEKKKTEDHVVADKKANSRTRSTDKAASTKTSSKKTTKSSQKLGKVDEKTEESGSLVVENSIDSSKQSKVSITSTEKEDGDKNEAKSNPKFKLFEITDSVVEIDPNSSTESYKPTRSARLRNKKKEEVIVKKTIAKRTRNTKENMKAAKNKLLQADEQIYDFGKQSKKIELVVNKENNLKSIIKSNQHEEKDQENKAEENEQTVETNAKKVAKSKRAVRILEQIDSNNDELNTITLDNKTKYAQSTSTPSGARRKPLKLPQDVSMICKPDTDHT